MPFSQRQYKRILKAVLPLIVTVWALLPGLACCQPLSTARTQPREASIAAFAIALTEGEHCADFEPDAPVPACPDVEKSGSHIRLFAASSVSHLSPLITWLSQPAETLRGPRIEPARSTLQHPLHLQKTVLLI